MDCRHQGVPGFWPPPTNTIIQIRRAPPLTRFLQSHTHYQVPTPLLQPLQPRHSQVRVFEDFRSTRHVAIAEPGAQLTPMSLQRVARNGPSQPQTQRRSISVTTVVNDPTITSHPSPPATRS
jgi:hypothetical protein